MIHISLAVASVIVAISCPWSRCFAGQPDQRPSQVTPVQAGVVVQGEISANNSSLSSWTVALIPLSRGKTQRTAPRPDGSFEFRDVTAGIYELRVDNGQGRTQYSQIVSLSRAEEMLSIRIPVEDPAPFKSQLVSVQQLQHKVPREARLEFRRGSAALKKRQLNAAVDHLKAAVAVDPADADAHNDLGVAYIRLREYEKGAEQFQEAIALDPTHQLANDNLCIALVKMGRYAEAGYAADRILRRGYASSVAHYAAAASLVAAGGGELEALNHLRRAEEDIPKAHLVAAWILVRSGSRTDAEREVEAYLRSRDKDFKRSDVEQWLAGLRQ